MRIPVKWGTDSGGCGPASESQTQAKVMMPEVDHFSQEKCAGEDQAASFRFIVSFFGSTTPDFSVPVMWSTIPVDVGRRSGGCGPPKRRSR